MLTGLLQQVDKVKYLLNDNSSTLLSAVGVGGTVATAVLTGRASFKAAELISEETMRKNMTPQPDHSVIVQMEDIRLSKTEKVQLVWRQYLPPVAMGVITVASIITANRISSKKIAALAVAGGISERALQEYKDKVVEKLGVRQDQKLQDEIAQDRVKNNVGNSGEIVIIGDGDVLCYDMLTGRYFKSSMEQIKAAENRINYELIHHMSASLSMFYEEIGLPPTTYTDMVGWTADNRLEVKLSTVLSSDNRPCIAIDFAKPPTAEYDRLYN
jgi:Family of unknown function (DUF6353)